ncbi:MAG: response regulator [Rhodospirillaceae bacterium]|jgi:two-component system cell cycle response regulator DivK|nr:response regulator [Rhodospirillaceae bacterium]MBT5664705.1 response regulator [Rhodospirillaceae bacterium]MBT5808938.1 response regulator [Rhodospirillaceae bacterium]
MAKTILIVEDNEQNMRLLVDLLGANGYRTLQSVDGLDALAVAEKDAPDLILMDIQLPHVSGIEVTKLFRSHETLKEIPIVAVTAFASPGEAERILDAGCDTIVSKPISPKSFLKTVAQFIGEAV